MALINETIRSMQLIFPPGDNRIGRMLEKAIDEQDLDHKLAGPYQISGPNEEDAGSSLLPIYVHELFDVFPHWGDRLYSILQEVAEPSPMSWHEKWSDRRKSPRYMYWAVGLQRRSKVSLIVCLCVCVCTEENRK